ncbi:MAG TPA: ABC transporter permease, partial [Ilumatobacteraceae bacterium]|nr:ABC transporter permease [Ilumatobacteraceae bacterium]
MLRFLLRRLVMLVVTLFISSFVIYASLYLAPGNPIATLSGGRTLPPQAVAVLEERYHLNDPFFVRYWQWLTGVLKGDFGVSIALRQEVSSLISARIGTTLSLVAYASVIILVVGIGLGVLGGLKPGKIDTGVLVLTTVLAALPAFVASTFLIGIFSVQLGWFPAFGTGEGAFDRFKHLTLPAFALAAASLALVARVTRTSVREEMRREHVQTAVSRGLPRRTIIRRHVLRNAAIPITTVAGITIASLIALAAVVERAFSLNGLGSYLVSAA